MCIFVDATSKITHVVVGENNKKPKRTFKFLYALAKGIPIVKESYIHDCLKNNKRLNEQPYISSGCIKGSHDAPLQSFNKACILNAKLFDGLCFVLLGTFHSPPKSNIIDLISAANGTIQESGIAICDQQYASKYQDATTSAQLFDAISYYNTTAFMS